jgi:2'-5' RNA ligase superfamily
VTAVRNHWWWRPGWHPGRRFYAFHLTFEQQPAVQQLAAAARDRLAVFTALNPVPGRWLHLTTQGIGFADAVSDSDLAALAVAAGGRLASVPGTSVTVNVPGAVGEGVVCWVGPDGVLDPVRDALRAAIASVWGLGRVPDSPQWYPHVSFAYANADADGDEIDAALEGLSPAAVTITTVELIRLGRDRHVYEWEPIATLPLAGPR